MAPSGVIPFPSADDREWRQIEDAVRSNCLSPHPKVQECATEAVIAVLKKHFAKQPYKVSLDVPPSVSEADAVAIVRGVEPQIAEWYRGVVLGIVADLCVTQLDLCRARLLGKRT